MESGLNCPFMVWKICGDYFFDNSERIAQIALQASAGVFGRWNQIHHPYRHIGTERLNREAFSLINATHVLGILIMKNLAIVFIVLIVTQYMNEAMCFF